MPNKKTLSDELLSELHEAMRTAVLRDAPPPRANEAEASVGAARASPQTIEDYKRKAYAEARQAGPPGPIIPPTTVAVAIAEAGGGGGKGGFETVIASARTRNNRVFLLNLLFVVLLTLFLIAGVGGAIITVLAGGANIWASVFGGIAAIDILVFILTRPEQGMIRALRKATSLDAMVFVYGRQFDSCDQHATVKDQMDCREATFQKLQADLKKLDD